jgi:hypothetical protein
VVTPTRCAAQKPSPKTKISSPDPDRSAIDQAFQFAGGLADICGLAHLVLLTRVGAVSGWQHGAAQDRYPTLAGASGGLLLV